ncbi:MAG: acetylornithine transaminase [Candidatus Nanopelagicales bacterium]
MNNQLNWNNLIAPTYASPKLKLVAGKGSYVYDETGKSYLDFLSGIAVTALGHAHPVVAEAVALQVTKLGHVSNLFANPIAEVLADKLLVLAGMPGGRVFFCNSGAEANEAAIKYIRAYKPKSNMVAIEGGFHGRTIGALSVTGQPEKRAPFEPLMKKVEFIRLNDLGHVAKKITTRTGGVWLEMIQGEAGVIPLDPSFISTIVNRSRSKIAALVIDEVQTGIGRTGSWFAFQGMDLKPDFVPIAKGLGGGLPIGALLISEPMAEMLKPGGHGTTFGGNPIAAAASLAVLETISKERLIDNAIARGKELVEKISVLPQVADVRGKGLLLGIVFDSDIAKQVESAAMSNGLIVNAVRPNVIRLAPPLNVSVAEVNLAIELLNASLLEVLNHE